MPLIKLIVHEMQIYCTSIMLQGIFSLFLFFAPLVLLLNLLHLLRGEVIFDVEQLPDLLTRVLGLDQVGHSHAAHVQQAPDLQEVCRPDD